MANKKKTTAKVAKVSEKETAVIKAENALVLVNKKRKEIYAVLFIATGNTYLRVCKAVSDRGAILKKIAKDNDQKVSENEDCIKNRNLQKGILVYARSLKLRGTPTKTVTPPASDKKDGEEVDGSESSETLRDHLTTMSVAELLKHTHGEVNLYLDGHKSIDPKNVYKDMRD